MLHTKEHYDLMEQFEAQYRKTARLDREDKSHWARGRIYQHGEVNDLFLAFRRGYALGKFEYDSTPPGAPRAQ